MQSRLKINASAVSRLPWCPMRMMAWEAAAAGKGREGKPWSFQVKETTILLTLAGSGAESTMTASTLSRVCWKEGTLPSTVVSSGVLRAAISAPSPPLPLHIGEIAARGELRQLSR